MSTSKGGGVFSKRREGFQQIEGKKKKSLGASVGEAAATRTEGQGFNQGTAGGIEKGNKKMRRK